MSDDAAPDEGPTTAAADRRGAALMASGTAVSRVLGVLRGIVLVAAVGAAGQAADAFAIANNLPNVLYMLLVGGVLNAMLVPQVVRAYRQKIGQEYVDRLLTLGFVVLAALTVVLTLAAPLIVNLYANFRDPDQQALAVAFAWWCIPQVFFYGMYALLGQVLNARGSFGPYMWAPVVNNVVSIAGFSVFIWVFGVAPDTGGIRDASAWDGGMIALLAGLSTLGVVTQALVLFPALRRAGVRYRPRWGVRGYGLGRAGHIATWTLLGLVIGQVGYIVVSRVASGASGDAAGAAGSNAGNTVYNTGFLVFMLPHSLVTVSLATALFTRLSHQAHAEDKAGVRSTFSSGVRIVGVFTLLAMALFTVLAEPIARILAPTETSATQAMIAPVIVAMIVGLPAFGAWSMCQRVFYAYEDARGMVPIQLVMAAVVAGGALLGQAVLSPSRWVVGIGLAMSVSYLVGAVLAMLRMRRHIAKVDGPRIVRLHVRALVAAVVAGGVGLAVLVPLGSRLADGFVESVTECVVVGAVITLVYVGLLRVLRVRELDELLRPFVGRARRMLPSRLFRGRR